MPIAVAAAAAASLSFAAAAFATTYTVNTAADNPAFAGECAGLPADCSLREALDRAQSGDTVVIPASAASYVIVDQRIPVRGGVSIEGAGASASTVSGAGIDQAFELLGGAPVRLAGLSIIDTFNDSGEPEAGAINGEASEGDDLTLEGVSIRDSASLDGYGGAIEDGSAVTVRHSRFSEDSATLGGGGAIDIFPGKEPSLSVSDSVFEGDSAGPYGGGALLVEGGASMSVTASTFDGDTAADGAPGGAIQLDAGSTGTIYNSTFTADSAGSGGAVSSEASQLALVNDTLAGNGAEVGAGLAVGAGKTSAENTIFAAPLGGGANCSGKVSSAGHNLDEATPSSCGLSPKAADIVGANPLLGALAANSSIDPTAGGPPETLAPAPVSPALGAGSAVGCSLVGSLDERGFPRPGSGSSCDVGAYETLAPVPTSTTISLSPGASVFGDAVTLSASVHGTETLPGAVPGPQGSVEFRDGSLLLGDAPVGAGGTAVLQTSALPLGEQMVSAVYGGDAVHTGSSAAAVPEQVAPATPSPTLTALRETRRAWREGKLVARASARSHRPPVGTTFSFSLNTAATVQFAFARTLSGRSVGGRCVAGTRRNRRRRACVRSVTVATLDVQLPRAGRGELLFQGRLTRALHLPPGHYLAVVRARNSVGSSPASSIGFTILPS